MTYIPHLPTQNFLETCSRPVFFTFADISFQKEPKFCEKCKTWEKKAHAEPEGVQSQSAVY